MFSGLVIFERKKMESDLQQQQQQRQLHDLQHQNQPRQLNSGLTRYQSAPSSYFSSFLDTEFCENFLNRPPSPETERIFDRFLSNGSGNASENTNMMEAEPPQSPPQQQQQGNYSASRSFYQNQCQSQQTLQNLNSGYGAMNSVGMDRLPPTKTATGGGNNSNLIRHSSSPAGLFADIEIENGYVVMKDYGRPPAPAPAPPTSSSGNNTASFIEDQSSNYSTDLSAAAETQNVELGNRPPRLLAHHLSLPKDLSAIENLLQFQDSVPCKIRAKRGFATHPRSIAERVRRTKISERMRKLQDLVPNMDKQTNTADMLDLAVDYVKELRNQVKALSDNRGKCTCSNKQEQP